MAIKWYYPIDSAGAKINFEFPHEIEGMQKIVAQLSRSSIATDPDNVFHVLINIQEHLGAPYRPDMLVISKKGACAIDLKNYDHQINLKKNPIGNYACCDQQGKWFSAEGESGRGEAKQVAGYALDLKKWVSPMFNTRDTIRIGFALCFTGEHATPLLPQDFSSATAGTVLAYIKLTTPDKIVSFIKSSVFGPTLQLAEQGIAGLISQFKVKEFPVEDTKWLKVRIESPLKTGEEAFEKSNIYVGRSKTGDIILREEHVSSKHLTIQQSGAGVILTDTSKNGTLANGQKMLKDFESYYDFPVVLKIAPELTQITLRLSRYLPDESSTAYPFGTV